MVYFFFMFSFQNQAFDSCGTSQFRPVTCQMLNSKMWLVATLSNSVIENILLDNYLLGK